MTLKSILLSLILFLTPILALGQTLSEPGCQFVASVAAHAVLEAQGKEPKGSTIATVEQVLDRKTDPGKAYQLIDSLIEKYVKLPKLNPDKVFEVEYIRCLKAGGDIDKLLPTRV